MNYVNKIKKELKCMDVKESGGPLSKNNNDTKWVGRREYKKPLNVSLVDKIHKINDWILSRHEIN